MAPKVAQRLLTVSYWSLWESWVFIGAHKSAEEYIWRTHIMTVFLISWKLFRDDSLSTSGLFWPCGQLEKRTCWYKQSTRANFFTLRHWRQVNILWNSHSENCNFEKFGFELVVKWPFTISSHDSMLYKFLPSSKVHVYKFFLYASKHSTFIICPNIVRQSTPIYDMFQHSLLKHST